TPGPILKARSRCSASCSPASPRRSATTEPAAGIRRACFLRARRCWPPGDPSHRQAGRRSRGMRRPATHEAHPGHRGLPVKFPGPGVASALASGRTVAPPAAHRAGLPIPWSTVMNTNVSASRTASYVTTADGVQLYYKDWGPKDGPVVTFSHGWPLGSDSWEAQMLFLADHGYLVVAHDRRGYGRSSQPWDGNDMDHYADDLAAVIEALDLREATLVGFSTGGGEVARYIGRHGTSRVRAAVLVSSVP